MPLFEVKVKRTSTVYFEVEAKSAKAAEALYNTYSPDAEFTEQDELISVSELSVDDEPFEESAYGDEYEDEQYEYDE